MALLNGVRFFPSKRTAKMPLIAAQCPIFPENLFECTENELGADQQWWVLHTRPRAEKALARRFLKERISYFLPQFKRKWRQGGRAFCAYRPLFPGYIFLLGSHDARLAALTSNLVARVLCVEDQSQLLHDLRQVHQLMQQGNSLAPEDRLQTGSMVEIAYGPFAGMEGKVIFRNKLRFVV